MCSPRRQLRPTRPGVSENTTGGVKHTDMGDQVTKDSGGTNEFRAFVDFFDWHWGLAVEDYRYVCRVANVMRPYMESLAA